MLDKLKSIFTINSMNDILANELKKNSIALAVIPIINPIFDRLDMKIDLNSLNINNRYVGNDNHKIYPDIVAWKPSSNNSTEGTTNFAAFIETEKTLENFDRIKDWQFSASLSIVSYLIIPASKNEEVLTALKSSRINNLSIATYSFNDQTKKYEFVGI